MKQRPAKSGSLWGNAARWVNKSLLRRLHLVLIRDMEHRLNGRGADDAAYAGNDFIRSNSLVLLAEEIRRAGVPGACAELGVFRGDFARQISAQFPERKIYLYDTFEGFSERDLATERANRYSLNDESFAHTSAELVLSRMPHPEKCVVRRSFFPATAQPDQNERFALVSLDTDLYDPIYEGLRFFYERLSPGGYILVHDYLNPRYKGAGEAVRAFARERGVGFCPLSDHMGSAVFCK